MGMGGEMKLCETAPELVGKRAESGADSVGQYDRLVQALQRQVDAGPVFRLGREEAPKRGASSRPVYSRDERRFWLSPGRAVP